MLKLQDGPIARVSKKRLEIQGYTGLTDGELNDFKYGIRFAYYLCSALLMAGLLLENVKILMVVMAVAFLGTLGPYHPFDYLYNYGIRHLIQKPKIPRRTNQGRFACGIATVWLGVIIYMFHEGLSISGYIAGGILLSVAVLVSTTDICIPSMIYNSLFGSKNNDSK